MNQNKLTFSVNKCGNAAIWAAEGLPTHAREDGDFWRIMMDDGYYREMPVYSRDQIAESITTEKGKTTVVYNGLVGRDGRKFDVVLKLTVKDAGDMLTFDAEIENRDEARVNELEYPYVDLSVIANEEYRKDVLYRPNAMGERIENPRAALAKSHTEYMSADYEDIKSTLAYPRPATMAWMGVESAGHFLYIGRHDPEFRACTLLTALAPRGASDDRMSLALCHYPFAREGETVSIATCAVSLTEGDWREGSQRYRRFADETFYKPHPRPQWVKDMHGWQRIILRHQYGEAFWKYEDLPRIYLEGKKSGLDTLMVFGWWKGRFDNGYPLYEIDEELGGEQGLKDAIAEVQRLGGRVIHYNNGILIDTKSDFFRDYGDEVAKIDIDGNMHMDHYKFENNGTVLRNYGYKTFVRACHAAPRWKDVMVNNARQKLSYGCDAIFYDQLGQNIAPCFNPKHRHGNRADSEAVYRMENTEACRAELWGDKAIGTECANDFAVTCVDFLHGCERGVYYKKNDSDRTKTGFHALFRHTFPEIPATNRFQHDCRDGFVDELNYTFVNGYRFDVSIYRGRKCIISDMPEYAECVGKLNKLKDQYAEFFFGDGHYVYDTVPELEKGKKLFFGEHISADGKYMMAFSNASDEDAEVSVYGQTVTVPAHDVVCVRK